jgi:hypothetical protein
LTFKVVYSGCMLSPPLDLQSDYSTSVSCDAMHYRCFFLFLLGES